MFWLAGCGDNGAIRIFAASSLQDVLPEILDAYVEEHAGIKFRTQYGGSQSLATQLELGAEADVFISANAQQLDRLDDEGLIVMRAPIVMNRLVIAVATDSLIGGIEDLEAAEIRIAIGAPDVPVGALTGRALDLLDAPLAEAIRANVVTEDPNVRVVLSRVELGEVDAAFVYRTDVIAIDGLRAIELPVEIEPNVYLGAVIKGAPDEATTLLGFLGSDVAEGIWQAAGFEAVARP